MFIANTSGKDAMISHSFYGDKHRWFFGLVTNCNDPLMLGRVQVRIYGNHPKSEEALESEALPWAQTMIPTTEGGVSGIGKMARLLPGAKVVGFFLDGDTSQVPFIMGAVHTIEDPSPIQLDRLAVTDDKSLTLTDRIAKFFVGQSNAEIVHNFFLSSQFSHEHCCAIVGGLTERSGVRIDAQQITSLNEYGIARWKSIETTGNRFQLLKQFAGQRRQDWRTLNTQLMFVLYELRTYSYFGLNQFLKATNIEKMTDIFARKYLREQDSTKITQMVNFAKDALERFG
jgi:hypothetical protein